MGRSHPGCDWCSEENLRLLVQESGRGLIENISHDPGHGSKEGQEENRTGKTLRQEALEEER